MDSASTCIDLYMAMDSVGAYFRAETAACTELCENVAGPIGFVLAHKSSPACAFQRVRAVEVLLHEAAACMQQGQWDDAWRRAHVAKIAVKQFMESQEPVNIARIMPHLRAMSANLGLLCDKMRHVAVCTAFLVPPQPHDDWLI